LSKQDKTIRTQRYAIFLNLKELIPIHLKLLIIRKRSNLSNDILGQSYASEISLDYALIRFDKEFTAATNHVMQTPVLSTVILLLLRRNTFHNITRARSIICEKIDNYHTFNIALFKEEIWTLLNYLLRFIITEHQFAYDSIVVLFMTMYSSSFQVSYKGNIIEEAHILAETLLHTTK